MTCRGVKCSPSWRPPVIRSSQGSEHPVPTGLAAWGVAQARCRDRKRRRPLLLGEGEVLRVVHRKGPGAMPSPPAFPQLERMSWMTCPCTSVRRRSIPLL
ncbi:MAG: hypothetical protein RLZZ142_1016 [Verrucomicrobiota bacterium]